MKQFTLSRIFQILHGVAPAAKSTGAFALRHASRWANTTHFANFSKNFCRTCPAGRWPQLPANCLPLERRESCIFVPSHPDSGTRVRMASVLLTTNAENLSIVQRNLVAQSEWQQARFLPQISRITPMSRRLFICKHRDILG